MVHQGDMFDVLPTLDTESVDACVTDPPYDLTSGKKGGSGPASLNLRSPAGRSRIGTGFMGLAWDGTGVAFNVETWRQIFRVLKPGAFIAAFGGTRTSHRMTCAIEDAGFEIRDCLSWLYGSGFPKSLNVGNGQGTALKPAWEPIVLARKPTIGTVAANVLRHSTGALNIDACRIDGDEDGSRNRSPYRLGSDHSYAQDEWTKNTIVTRRDTTGYGRWPANVLLDEDAAAMLDAEAPFTGAAGAKDNRGRPHGFKDARFSLRDDNWGDPLDERSGASRFYYVAKPSQEERNFGAVNKHPTVKPVELMRWLVKLVVPVNGVCLDPFTGSGTTGMACEYELRQFIGIEREPEYAELAKQRIAAVAPLFSGQVQG